MDTSAILQEMMREIIDPIAIQRKASDKTEIVSVVSPLSLVISSERIFESTPGALSFESNQESYLCKISVNSSCLNLNVKFSPTKVNKYF